MAPRKAAASKNAIKGGDRVAVPSGGSSANLKTQSSSKGAARQVRNGRVEKKWDFSHVPDQNDRSRNGRQKGRNLIAWGRPRMAEKVLLHLQYECSRYKIDLPWDSVAHRLHPGSSGGAVVQRLNRLRTELVNEGHLVPPICQKIGSKVVVDAHVRGYARDPKLQSSTGIREVRFGEPFEDRKFNLPDAVDLNNSIPTTAAPSRKPAKRNSVGTKVKVESSDSPGDDSEDEYVPNGKTVSNCRRSSRPRPDAAYIEANDGPHADYNEPGDAASIHEGDEEAPSDEADYEDAEAYPMVDDTSFHGHNEFESEPQSDTEDVEVYGYQVVYPGSNLQDAH